MKYISFIFYLFILGCTLGRPENVNLHNYNIPDIVITDNQMNDVNINILVLSGGGPNGVWAIGYLRGWDNKPNFNIVTGVSAGSLIATHAFINETSDKKIDDVINNFDSDHFLSIRNPSLIIFNNSISSNKKLAKIVDGVISNDIIDKVYEEGKSGKKLYIATTDLDYGKSRIWDMVDIASKKEYDKYRSIVLASASIPILFPPVFIDDSMNVDGAVTKLVFIPEFTDKNKYHKNIYILRNGLSYEDIRKQVDNSIKDIGIRSANLMINLNLENSIKEIKRYPNSTVYYTEMDGDVAISNYFSFNNSQIKDIYTRSIEHAKKNKWKQIIENKPI